MQFFQIASTLALATFVIADSQTIGLMTLRSGSQYQYTEVKVSDGTLTLADGTGVEGVVTDDGKFKLSDGSYITVNSDNTLSTSDDGSSGFSIGNAYLQYDGSSAFSIADDEGVLVGSSGSPVSIGATVSGGFADDFTPSGSSSGESSSAVASSSGYHNTTASSTIVSSVVTSSSKPTATAATVSTFDNGAAALSGAGALAAIAAALLI